MPPKPASYGAPAPPIFPAPVPSNPPMPRPPAVLPSALAPDGATGAFFRPVSDPAPTPQAAPSGPSAYTQIISARAPSPAADAAGAQKEPPAKAAGSPAFAMPALAVPAMAPPPLPPPPVPPRPAFAVPAPPAAPEASCRRSQGSESGGSGTAARFLLAAYPDIDGTFFRCRSAGALLCPEALRRGSAGNSASDLCGILDC